MPALRVQIPQVLCPCITYSRLRSIGGLENERNDSVEAALRTSRGGLAYLPRLNQRRFFLIAISDSSWLFLHLRLFDFLIQA